MAFYYYCLFSFRPMTNITRWKTVTVGVILKMMSVLTKKMNSLQRVFLHHLFFLFLERPGGNYEKNKERITLRDCSGVTLSPQVFAQYIHIAVLHLQVIGLKDMAQSETHQFLNALATACSLTAQ